MLTNVFLGLLMSLFSMTTSSELASSGMTGMGFGRPVADCSGAGICIVTSDFQGREGEENFGLGEFVFSKGQLKAIKVDRYSLTKSTIERHFSQDYFPVEMDYEGFLMNGKKKLKIDIPSGKYKMSKTSSEFIIMIGE